MSYGYGNPNYTYPPGFTNQYAQPQQQSYQGPAIQNPFPAPPPAGAYGAQNAGYDASEEAQLAQWQSAYAAPQETSNKKDARRTDNPNTTQLGQRPNATNSTASESKATADGKKYTVVRAGGGETWQDTTLLEWDPTQFRIMVGNLAGEVTDDSLAKAFDKYGVAKARVVRDKRTTKSRGFGFVSFTDGELGFKAAREMLGKYIGSHPITIQRSKVDIRPQVEKDKKGKGKGGGKGGGKKEKKGEDPLRANTGAHIEKKPVKNPGPYKVIGGEQFAQATFDDLSHLQPFKLGPSTINGAIDNTINSLLTQISAGAGAKLTLITWAK